MVLQVSGGALSDVLNGLLVAFYHWITLHQHLECRKILFQYFACLLWKSLQYFICRPRKSQVNDGDVKRKPEDNAETGKDKIPCVLIRYILWLSVHTNSDS